MVRQSRGARGRSSTRIRNVATAALATGTLLTTAACTSAAAPGDDRAASGGAADGQLSAASVQTIADYTGSKTGQADPSLPPVTWGYVNQEGGAMTFPLYTLQVKALVDVVNDQLGGVGGHRLQLSTCFVVASDEDGQRCGQQFANDPNISAILQFPLINGDAAFHRVIDPTGIPVFGPGADTPVDAAATSAFFTSGSSFSTVPIMASYAVTKLHPKTAAIIGIQGNPISTIVTSALQGTLKAAGVTTSLAQVSPTSTDVVSALVAAKVKTADVIIAPLDNSRLCANIAKGISALGAESTPVVAIALCASTDLKALLGDYPRWAYVGQFPSPLAAPLDAREAAQIGVIKDLQAVTGSPTDGITYTPPSAQAFLTALAIVQKAGGPSATAATVKATAKAFTGPLFLGPDRISWGSIPTMPAVPTLAQRVYASSGDDTWKDVGGGWFQPAA